jgi:20S proteasome subunit beta 7
MSLHSFLGYVDLLGTTYQSPTIATGFGAYIAQPLLRNAVDDRAEPLSENEAVAVIQLCMKALFYRDARSLNKVRYSSLSV